MTASDILPIHISDNENLARAIFEPIHIKKGKLKSAAFKAPAGKKDVSVNRLLVLCSNDCKEKAKKMESDKKVYKGLAVIVAGTVRGHGSDVVDSREPPMYYGHADIIHDVVLERHKPAPPEFNRRLSEMARAATFYPDTEPN